MSYAVAIVRPQTENRVASSIAELGVDVFNPRIKLPVIRRGRRVYRTEPLFRRYVFVEICEQIFEILRIKYLIGLIMTTDNTLAVVKDHEIENIKRQCSDDDVLFDVKPKFIRGELVRPKTGALMDMIGKFESSSRNRETATFCMLGRERFVSFKIGDLVAA